MECLKWLADKSKKWKYVMLLQVCNFKFTHNLVIFRIMMSRLKLTKRWSKFSNGTMELMTLRQRFDSSYEITVGVSRLSGYLKIVSA